MYAPRLEIDLAKLTANARRTLALYRARGIGVTAVTKGVCGSPGIASALLAGGVRSLGDAHIANILRMRRSGIAAEFMLIRSPMPSEIRQVVRFADLSVNTELSVIRLLSDEAVRQGKTHRVILMIELGDLREGILPHDVESVAAAVLALPGVELAGVGTNLTCLGNIAPNKASMNLLSELADRLQRRHGLELQFVSGGNSANYRWFVSTADLGLINHLRIGESMLLGRDTLTGQPIPGLHKDAFNLVAEVIEVKTKPMHPRGVWSRPLSGHQGGRSDRGNRRRALLAVGRQDVDCASITPRAGGTIVGATSDHLVLSTTGERLDVGSQVSFDVGYQALLRAMVSPYVQKVHLSQPVRAPHLHHGSEAIRAEP